MASTAEAAGTGSAGAGTGAGAGGAGVLVATHSAPTNIAVIKYWGKRDTKLNLPINSSVSVTLNQDDLKATTSIAASKAFTADRIWLNGTEESISNPRIQSVLREMRARAGDRAADAETGAPAVAAAEWAEYHFHIVSENNFPTAAGLASSAAGYACMVSTLADLLCVKEKYVGELSTIARQGSGSSCRSLYGGFVKWQMGAAEDGADSMAVQVAKQAHWPELEALIFVVSAAKKETGSTVGMQRSVETSKLLAHRAAEVVEDRLARIERAYLDKDFATFGEITMRDSNQFHSCCLDTYPPVFYMNDVSRRIIAAVHHLNKSMGRTVAAYTFDAGPNAVLYVLHDDVPVVLKAMAMGFGPDSGDLASWVSNDKVAATAAATEVPAEHVPGSYPNSVPKVYHTTVGDGPRVLPLSEALVDVATGFPKSA